MPEVPSDFEGFVYEPSREQEVIAIFFRILPKLNLSLAVDEVRGSFPDCIGWKRTEDGFEEFDIEFELFSSNFLNHGHNEEKCDLIVCWEDDWPGSPVEVLELKKILEEFEDEFVFSDEPKFTHGVWTKEEFLNKVKDSYPEISDIQEKLFEAFEESDKVRISMGEGDHFGTYSIYLPSTDHEVRMGVREDGGINLGFKEFSEECRRRLAEAFREELGIEINPEKKWIRALWLEGDLDKEELDKFLNILLEKDFTHND